MMRRTPLKRATKPLRSKAALKRRRPLRSRARKPQGLAAAVEVVKERSGGVCEAQVPGVCVGTGRHAHHVVLRSAGGEHTPANLLWLCPACHGWAHGNPAAALELGLIKHRWTA